MFSSVGEFAVGEMGANMSDIRKAALNMLVGCGELSAGDDLVVFYEPADLGYYDREIVMATEAAGRALGAEVTLCEVPFQNCVCDPDEQILAMIENSTLSVFLARMGDQIRFQDTLTGFRAIVCYALDGQMLASGFGTIRHQSMVALKGAVDRMVAGAKAIEVTCKFGTSFSGLSKVGMAAEDVSIRRFPMSVFTPVPAVDFSGTVAQRGFLVGTGSKYYTPNACRIEDTLFVHFASNKITGFDGKPKDVEIARAHYRHVAEQFDIDADFIHSWHLGIHPACAYDRPANADFDRWAGGAFGNPRLLHFHTCGAYAPGEISLNVLDPTVSIDGVAVWQDGRLEPSRIPGGSEILSANPELARAFEAPSQECGLGDGGELSFS